MNKDFTAWDKDYDDDEPEKIGPPPDTFLCWHSFDRDRARRRVLSVVHEWERTVKESRVADRKELVNWLNALLYKNWREHKRWPTRGMISGWAKQYMRDSGFKGSNKHKAGEDPELSRLHEDPIVRVNDDDELEALYARRACSLPYGVRRSGRTADQYDEWE